MRQGAQLFDVGILNVAAIFAQMDGNAVGTANVCFDSSPDGLRFIGLPCLPDGGDVVNINAEFDHNSCNSLKIFRDSSSLPPV